MYVLLFAMQFFACFASLSAVESHPTLETLPSHCRELLEEVVEGYFNGISENEIVIAPLTGGHSNICLKIIADGKSYVLRISNKWPSSDSLKGELLMMEQAADIGIAPKVFYHSKDYRAVLMDYVEGGTSTVVQNKQPESCIKIANAIRKVHAIEKNPYADADFNQAAVWVYSEICTLPRIKTQLERALELMWKYTAELEKYHAAKVNIHGELNPRNIFIKDEGAIFIDWEYTCLADPFFDLSYLSLRLDYTPEEELLLLEAYLQHSASPVEFERYYLTKKIHFAQLCIFFHYFSQKFITDQTSVDETVPLKPWSYYMELFSDQPDNGDALGQFYNELARTCLKFAEN